MYVLNTSDVYSFAFNYAGDKEKKVEFTHTFTAVSYTHLDVYKRQVQMIADKWLKESLWEISQKRIYLECVREEMEELQKKAA